jgi:hypothetical protein
MEMANARTMENLKARRLWLILDWILVVLFIYLSLTPVRLEVPIDQGNKLSHAPGYSVSPSSSHKSYLLNGLEEPYHRFEAEPGRAAEPLFKYRTVSPARKPTRSSA